MSDYQTNAGESSKRKILILFCFVAFFFLYIRVQLLDSWRRVWGRSRADLGRRNAVPWGFVPAKFETPLSNFHPDGLSSGKASFTGDQGGGVGILGNRLSAGGSLRPPAGRDARGQLAGPGRAWRWARAGGGGEGWRHRPSMMSMLSVGASLRLLSSAPVPAVPAGCSS